MDALLALAVTCVFILIMAITCIVISKILNFYFNKKEKIFNNKHADYINFYEKYEKLKNELYTLKTNISKYKGMVDHYLKEMKYFPECSEWYQYYEAKLNVTRCTIDRNQEACNTKEQEILDFVKTNRNIIESIKEDKRELYNDWIDRYNLE
jgi:hypothetical protein